MAASAKTIRYRSEKDPAPRGIPIRSGAIVAVTATLAVLILISSCGQPRIPTAFTSSRVAPDTSLRINEVNAFLTYLNGVNPEGRGTGTRGFARAARYVSLRLASYGVQPIVQKEFARFYVTSLNIPRVAEARLFRPDSLHLRSGLEIIADGRSRSDSLTFSSVIWQPDSSMNIRGEVVAIPVEMAADRQLQSLAQRGARVVIIRGQMDTRSHRRPIGDLTAVRIVPEALERLIPSVTEQAGRVHRLPVLAELRTRVEYTPSASALNVMAMIPGADPVLRNELIVIGARLDGFGIVSDQQWTDGTDTAIGAVVVLEASRILAQLQRWSHPLKRTVLISFWSGSLQGETGVKAFLQHPPWAAESIRTVIHVLDPAEDDRNLREIYQDANYRFLPIASQTAVRKGEFQKRQELLTPAFRNDLLNESRQLVSNLVATAVREASVR